MPRVPAKTSAPPPLPASGTDPPRVHCAPGSLITVQLICPCCHASVPLTLSTPQLPMTAPPQPPPPPYALVQEPGGWKLTFDASQTTLPRGAGVLCVAHLLQCPRVPVPAARLAAQIQTRHRPKTGLTGIPDPDGGSLLPDDTSIIEEAPVKIGDSKLLRELRRQHAELEAILDNEQASEPEQAEAQRDLEQNEKLQHQYLGRFQDTAQKAARAVRKSIYRFLHTLRAPPRGQTAPHPLLLRFADHLAEYLIIPSHRYSGPRALIARAELAGCLLYEPPPGIVWAG
jgi:hypothetical protein